ncbi:MAG TPA: hypothetical protein ENH29_07150 [Bacteroidetes bacterium]|nr:hypothetical protein [Bacteroidota bacterium]
MFFLYGSALVTVFFVVLLFFSSNIIVQSNNSGDTPVHTLELRILFHVVRISFSFRDKQKSIQMCFWRWPLLTKKISQKQGIKKRKKKKIAGKSGKHFSEKLKNILSYTHLNLVDLKQQTVALLKSFRRPELNGRIRIGFGNPMYTGLMMGSYAMVATYWPEVRQHVLLQPEFTCTDTQWQLSLKVDCILACLLWRGLLIGRLFWQMKRKSNGSTRETH